MHNRLVLCGLLLLLVGAFAFAGPAAATTPPRVSGDRVSAAQGCTYFGYVNVGGHSIPGGKYCAILSGSGLFVGSVNGAFALLGTICNWNITAEFFDHRGNWYSTYNGPVHYGCWAINFDTININRYARDSGMMCSTLKQNGSRVTSVCLYIHP